MPTQTVYPAGVALDNNRALVCGGNVEVNGHCVSTNTCYIYTLSTDTWTQAASIADSRQMHQMVMLDGECCVCVTQ
jgi:hypothetical protein